MANFQSKMVITKDKREIRVWMPLTEAGYLEPIVDDAVAAGVLLKADGEPFTQPELEEYRKELRTKFHEKEIADLKKRKPY